MEFLFLSCHYFQVSNNFFYYNKKYNSPHIYSPTDSFHVAAMLPVTSDPGFPKRSRKTHLRRKLKKQINSEG